MIAEYKYAQSLLLVEEVNLVLGGKKILRDVNAEIRNIVRPGMQQGQVVALLGPSGIGKTQLLHLIAGLKKPTTGHVLVPMERPNEFQEVQRGQVGVVFQNYPLFEHRTVMGNLQVTGTDLAQAASMIERFGLGAILSLYPAQLSGGQRQRVAIAQQLLCSEHFLLMDEPFSGLDVIAEAEVCKVICETATVDELNTIIVVTHDVTAAATVADHIWLMGREKDKPGARIVETYDLIERDLCWHPDIGQSKELAEFVREVKERFRHL